MNKNNIFWILFVIGISYWSIWRITSGKNRYIRAYKRGLERRRLLNKK
jgi:hypothetical protein